MSLTISHLDAYPEPQEGEETVVLLVTVAQPQKRGDAEGWRARAQCVENDRVIGRWMGDCPLSVTQSALLWLSLHPWEVVSDENGVDYTEILESVERPVSNDQMHVRELLERIATNLPMRPSEVRNAVTGARIQRRTLALPGPVAEPEDEDEVEGDEPEDDVNEVDEVTSTAHGRRVRAEQAERNRLLQKALALAQEGRDPDQLARALERRADADLAETFRVALLAIAPPAPPRGAKTPDVANRAAARAEAERAAAEIAAKAEAEIARFAVGDESGIRAKLERTEARAARERAKVAAHLARMEAQRAREAAPVEPVAPREPRRARSAEAAPAPVAPAAPAVPAPVVAPPVAAPVLVESPVEAPKAKARSRKQTLKVVEPAAAG